MKPLSNWSKNRGKQKDTIYASFHLPGLTYTNAYRNTLKRLNAVQIPPDLEGVKVLELGSNMGALSLQLAERGAHVTGIEFMQERCDWANSVAEKFGLVADYHQGDLDNPWPDDAESKKYDLVLCTSVDNYIKDRERLFRKLKEVCDGVLWLEINDRSASRESIQQIMDRFQDAFPHRYYVFTDEDRYVFVMAKENAPWPVWFGRTRKVTVRKRDGFVKIVKNPREYAYLKWCYDHISHIKYVVPMDFKNHPHIWMPDMNSCETLYDLARSGRIISSYKNQFINFVSQLNKAGFRHGDLHLKNLLIKDGRLVVIDWDSLSINVAPLHQSWDVCGRNGLEIPDTYGPFMGVNGMFAKGYVKNAIGFEFEDFRCFPRLPVL